jgi:glutamine synthetase
MITCFDTIGDGPYGSLGDLLIMPDPRSKAMVELGGDAPDFRLLLGDIVNLDGSAWDCCTRSILKQALARLERVAGLRVTAAFEQEFHIKALDRPPGDAYDGEVAGPGHRPATRLPRCVSTCMPSRTRTRQPWRLPTPSIVTRQSKHTPIRQ